jgi:hypothetical protein
MKGRCGQTQKRRRRAGRKSCNRCNFEEEPSERMKEREGIVFGLYGVLWLYQEVCAGRNAEEDYGLLHDAVGDTW